MNPERTGTAPAMAPSLPMLYRAIWRWHFYAGLVVVPFLLVFAVTGLIMVYGNSVETFLGKKYHVAPGGERLSIVDQAAAAQAAIPGGTTRLFVSPAEDTRSSVFLVNADDKDNVVSLDPHDGKVLGIIVKDDTWFYWADHIHGTLLLGDFGDRLQEIAAGLGIVLVLTGLYLWWPRNARGWADALVPNLSLRGRLLWKQLHMTGGFYFSIVLLFFLISGLSWAGVWGAQFVQAWSTFPAAKWDNVPLSDETHASMNHGAMKEVPWALEQTPMPESGSQAGKQGIPMGMVNLDSVAAYAKSIGFDEQFRINLPSGPEGVYTISADSMDGDTHDPMGDRTVHIDQYSGKILADVRYADYSLGGKAMAVGIALHQGNLGLWNTILNTVYCLFVVFMCVSGMVMWWKRRPAGTLGAPRYPSDYRIPRGILVIGLAVAIAFPLTGIAIVAFAVIDLLLPKRLKEARVTAA
ncbi:PepSY-associated TM helix domain-containing protein [Dongia sp. agr-C8]